VLSPDWSATETHRQPPTFSDRSRDPLGATRRPDDESLNTVRVERPTMTDVSVVAVCGSLREESYTRNALAYAIDAAERSGATTRLLDLRTQAVPMYDPDVDDQGVSELLATVREADAVLLGSPIYHGTFTQELPRPLRVGRVRGHRRRPCRDRWRWELRQHPRTHA
jgi:hypothetical protein